MKKIFFTIFLLMSACGYQPLYKVQNEIIFEIKEIKFNGDSEISKEIFSKLPYNIIKNKTLNVLIIDSEKNIIETSKNSKGQTTSYKTALKVNFILLDFNKKVLIEKLFNKEFNYNTKKDKFKLKQYQNQIDKELIDKISEEIIIFLNS
tara:strand:+ start:7587 stop:8033 length:447 start_codon:yes stop_codon:yes gene_type:complete